MFSVGLHTHLAGKEESLCCVLCWFIHRHSAGEEGKPYSCQVLKLKTFGFAGSKVAFHLSDLGCLTSHLKYGAH